MMENIEVNSRREKREVLITICKKNLILECTQEEKTDVIIAIYY